MPSATAEEGHFRCHHPQELDIGQSLLGEGGPDDVSGKVFRHIIVVRWNPRAAVDVEDEIFPRQGKLDTFFTDLPFPQEPVVNLVRVERFQGLHVEWPGCRMNQAYD